MAESERGQLMFRQHEQLPAFIAADVPGHQLAFMQQTQFIAAGADGQGFAHELRRRRVAIAVEGDAGMRIDDGRHDFVRVEGHGGQRSQQGTLLLEAIDGALARGLMSADVGHLIAPVNRQSEVIFEARQLLGPAGQGVVFDVAHAAFDNAFRFRIPPRTGDWLQAEVTAQR